MPPLIAAAVPLGLAFLEAPLAVVVFGSVFANVVIGGPVRRGRQQGLPRYDVR